MRKPIRLFSKRVIRNLYNMCDHIMLPTAEVEEIFKYNKIHTKSTIIPLGTAVDHFKPAQSKFAAKKKLGISEHCTVIGFVGRLAREKDVLTLYRAFIRLAKDHQQLRLLVVGDGIPEFSEHMKQRKDVILVGAQDDVVPYYQAMDMYVLPSLLETTSLSTLEAMSCGVVPVCTPVGYIKHYIEEKKNGLLFPKGNSLVLSLKLNWLLDNPTMRKELGMAARRTVKEKFSWKHTAEKIIDCIDALGY